jgi:choline kinase
LNAIILAAGEGKRLNPLTKNIPKGLVPLFGKSLLERQIEIFRMCNITDISIVTGYLGDMIKFSDVTYFQNPKYQNTNMVETLFCALEKLQDEVIVSYGDIIYSKKVLLKLLESKDNFSVVIDQGWEEYWKLRFENPLDDAESMILDDNDNIVELGKSVTDIQKIQGQYIGLMKFKGNAIELIKNFYKETKNQAKIGINPLNTNLSFEQSYMTDFLNGLIKKGHKLKAIKINHEWLEVDTYSDYQLYNKLYEKNNLKKWISLV